MAKLYGEIAAKALLTLDKSFARANGQPLDASEVYYSLEAAKTYAATAQAYIGQKIVVIEDGVVTHYSVEDTAGNLKELGSKPVADGTTVAIGEDGKITLANITEAEASGTYNAVLVNGKLTWVKPSETTVEGLSDLISALTGRVDTAEDKIETLEEAVGVAASEGVEASGLHKAIADEAKRAADAEKALGERIDAIDFIDSDELNTALEDYVLGSAFETFQTENTQAIADAKSGAETTAANALAAARTEISKEIDDDVKVAKDRADEAYALAETKVDAETYATDKKALEDEDAAIRAIAEGARDSINAFLNSEEIDDTVNTLKELQAEIDKMTDAAELTEALANKADKTALEGVEGRVKAIEDAPYVTESQLDEVDGKFEGYTDTDALTELLAGKQDVIPDETYDAFGAAAAAEEAAKGHADSVAATAKSEAIAAAATAAAGLYATKTEVGALETALDARLDVLEGIDHTAYTTNTVFNEYKTTVENTYATQTSLAEVKQTADNAAAKAETLEDKIDEITSVGGQPNVIEYIKVNGAIQTPVEKTVDITVPTKFSELTDNSGFSDRIDAALAAGNKGISDASAAHAAANQAQSEVDALELEVGALQTIVGGHTTTISDHTTRIAALEQADVTHATEYATLSGIVTGHTEAIAKKADITALDAANAKITANETAIKTINETTIPGINGEIAKKANSADVYTKTEVNAITGTVEEGKTIVQMIAEAKTAATYDDSKVKEDIQKNADAIAVLNGDINTSGSVAKTAAEAAKTEVATLIGDAPEALDTIHEIAAWIQNDESGAAALSNTVAAHSITLSEITNADTGILATAKAYTDDAIAGLPAATAEVLGLVKVDNVSIKADEGVISIKAVSTDLLVQGEQELVLNGGSAV